MFSLSVHSDYVKVHATVHVGDVDGRDPWSGVESRVGVGRNK
jgi:hypothetical protein